ncbi:MAG: LapA family protein [Ilumatobacter sp.]|uniref:LapA family protein n=1 Tax=Ilumatobacter sp. TaxID=1967498 RepID=UPI00262B2317|nr:LapA family protein [Ilumatobacter sp.]MDJ0768403.1 LapA family protein [Ilumatobacter sp.]
MNRDALDLEQPAESGGGAPSLKLIALLLVTIALAVFFFQNGDRAPVEFLWMDGDWPVWTVIGISVLAGVVLDRLFTWQWRRARRRKQTAA